MTTTTVVDSQAKLLIKMSKRCVPLFALHDLVCVEVPDCVAPILGKSHRLMTILQLATYTARPNQYLKGILYTRAWLNPRLKVRT